MLEFNNRKTEPVIPNEGVRLTQSGFRVMEIQNNVEKEDVSKAVSTSGTGNLQATEKLGGVDIIVLASQQLGPRGNKNGDHSETLPQTHGGRSEESAKMKKSRKLSLNSLKKM